MRIELKIAILEFTKQLMFLHGVNKMELLNATEKLKVQEIT